MQERTPVRHGAGGENCRSESCAVSFRKFFPSLRSMASSASTHYFALHLPFWGTSNASKSTMKVCVSCGLSRSIFGTGLTSGPSMVSLVKPLRNRTDYFGETLTAETMFAANDGLGTSLLSQQSPPPNSSGRFTNVIALQLEFVEHIAAHSSGVPTR